MTGREAGADTGWAEMIAVIVATLLPADRARHAAYSRSALETCFATVAATMAIAFATIALITIAIVAIAGRAF